MNKFVFLLCVSVLGGCAVPAVTTDVASDKVRVLQRLTTSKEDVLQEATRSCGIYGKKPVYVSTYTQDLNKVHLFACQ